MTTALKNWKEWRFDDEREDFEPGPWTNEPDKAQWTDEATNMPCLIVRNGIGNLCGYVGVTMQHPAFGMHYNDDDLHVDVHGGLTFSDLCQENRKERGVCHIAEPGTTDHVWWFGFDCAHAGDAIPSPRGQEHARYGVYRTVSYVIEQCTKLAAQLFAMTETKGVAR